MSEPKICAGHATTLQVSRPAGWTAPGAAKGGLPIERPDGYVSAKHVYQSYADLLLVLGIISFCTRGSCYRSSNRRWHKIDPSHRVYIILCCLTIGHIRHHSIFSPASPLPSDTPPFASRSRRLSSCRSGAGAKRLLPLIFFP